jgi:hypothetical protein
MCRAIADAYEVDEVKDIRDRVAALEHYSRQVKNVEAERQCCEIRLRAERKWRELYDAGEKAKAGRPTNNRSNGTTDYRGRTLAQHGVTKDQAARWAKLAAMPDDQFEAALAAPGKPTTNGIIRAGFSPTPKPVSPEALWLWGRLRDFRRRPPAVCRINPRLRSASVPRAKRTKSRGSCAHHLAGDSQIVDYKSDLLLVFRVHHDYEIRWVLQQAVRTDDFLPHERDKMALLARIYIDHPINASAGGYP